MRKIIVVFFLILIPFLWFLFFFLLYFFFFFLFLLYSFFLQLSLFCQFLPLAQISLALVQHGGDGGHHLGEQVIAGDADPTKKSNLAKIII